LKLVKGSIVTEVLWSLVSIDTFNEFLKASPVGFYLFISFLTQLTFKQFLNTIL